ncbi:hypothetical protein [Wohlfahrtiimonas larvae]|uniref:Uncharacterized protein n=1 Tax=Wohlfahrtiimonas larvae TaxID=1157986 RepID=A0ABP9MEY2_9GAMM|nr:hypothetical protein [Wohlfahrtiimonas larvae]
MKTIQLNILGQCAVFTLSPLVVPAFLSSCLLIGAIFEPKLLQVFSIPMMFSLVLGMLPAIIVGMLASTIRHFLKCQNKYINTMIWVIVAIVMNSLITAKFMTGISMHFVNLAYVAGAISAMIACSSILLLECFRNRIIFSRFYHKNTMHVYSVKI